MALPSSGQITLNQVNVELGISGTAQIDMNSAAVRGLFGVASGQIAMSNGYGKANTFAFTISSNTQQANLSTLATAAGWNGSSAVEVTIASGVYLWSDNVSVAGLLVNIANCTVTNNGRIIGKGGNGGRGSVGGAGGPAISVTATGVAITNNASAYIAGGGGGGAGSTSQAGGGGGAGGGTGGAGPDTGGGGAGGGLNSAGGNGSSIASQSPAQGGGAGGGAGTYNSDGTGAARGGGGGGGRILPGNGGAGLWTYLPNYPTGSRSPSGGSGGNSGGNGNTAQGGGGGGWGASGGLSGSRAGGSGGAAISNTSSYTLTNNGTVYGAT